MQGKSNRRIGVLVVAYNAVNTLIPTIRRIPANLMDRIEEIFVFDDHSNDKTYEFALNYKNKIKLDKLKIFRNEKNLKYGGNQKKGYRYAIDKGLDIVVLLHGDGQYAPEAMASLLEPVENGKADMVMGSRMMKGQNPLKGGMPVYKFLGNKILTSIENMFLGTNLSEFHSGYRVYSCQALNQVPFEKCSDYWHFDTDIIIQFLKKGLRISERPIPTYYGNEVCYVNGPAYAYRCLESVIKYHLHNTKFFKFEKFNV